MADNQCQTAKSSAYDLFAFPLISWLLAYLPRAASSTLPPMDARFSLRSVGQPSSLPPRREPSAVPPTPKGKARFLTIGRPLKEKLILLLGGPDASRKTRMLRGTGITAGLIALYFVFLFLTLPSINEQTIGQAAQSTVITDRNGVELYRLFGEEDRTYVHGEDIPRSMKDAVVAIEDERFYDRGCLDFRALARAVLHLGKSGGASTITRQLARNALDLNHENVINRKLKELILGCQLEHTYDKEKILELYLNWIPFGQNAYGVEQASQRYFGKSVKDLSLAESAVLASLPQMPSYLSPYGRNVHTVVSERTLERIKNGTVTSSDQIADDDFTLGLLGADAGTGSTVVYVGGRTDQVLHNMTSQGFITQTEHDAAIKDLKTLTFKPARESIRAPHFVLWTKDILEKNFAEGAEKGILEQGGLTIQTTLDWRLQEAAEKIVASHREDFQKRFMANNMALIAMDPKTREVLAYVGNADYADEEAGGKIDMVQVPRQPGSSFKPFVYAGAFLQGYNPATVLYDVPTKFGTYEPQNYEGSFQGLMTARQALGGSRNIPAIKAYFLAGEEPKLLALADALGMPTPSRNVPSEGYGPAMAIGAAETPLYEMAQGYATLADAGLAKSPVAILKITDRRGNLLPIPGEDASESEALDPRVAYQVTSVLSDASVRPGEYWQSILSVPGYQAAAKTGTSNKCLKRDEKQNCTERRPDNTWTMGYTPNLVTGVWVGNASAEPLSPSADGLTLAAPLWHDFMVKAHEILKENPDGSPHALTANFTMPSGMVEPQISMLSGELPTECTPISMRRGDVFLSENAPTLADPGCANLEVDRVTGLLASDECPVEAREMRSFVIPVTVLEDRFPQWKQSIVSWLTSRQPTMGPDGKPTSGSGASFILGLAPVEKCTIAATPGREIKPKLSILSPAQGGSAAYPAFRPDLKFTVGSKVREIRFNVDEKDLPSWTTEPFEGSIRVPRSIKEEGMHTLTVTVVDEYFNEVSDSVRFTFEQDTSGPRVFLTSPPDGTVVQTGSGILMRAEANDSEGSLKYVEFYLDDLLLTRKPREPYEVEYTPPLIMPGGHTVRAVATDDAGNTTEDTVRITVEEAGETGSGATE